MAAQKQKQKVQIISMEEVGKDDINFPEFCFGVIGKADTDSQPTELVFIDKINPDSKITISRGKYGFPNQTTRDLRLALMRLTFQKNGFDSDRVRVSASEILREMGLQKSGTSLKNLRKHLDILTDTRIAFENSYFDKTTGEKHTQTLKMSTLSGYRIAEVSKITDKNPKKLSSEAGFDGYILWQQDHFQNSLQNSKNLIQFDYPFYLSLNQDITKQLYLFLNKRRYNSKELRIELQVLAFEKLGISRSLENKIYSVRWSLKKACDTLQTRGFLEKYDIKKDKFTKKEFIHFCFNSGIRLPALPSQEQEPLLDIDPKWDDIKEKLLKFGVTEGQVGKLFRFNSYQEVKDAVDLLEMQYQGKKVKNPIGLITECLKGTYDKSALDRKRAEDKKEADQQKQFEIRELEQKAKQEVENKKMKEQDELAQAWIGKNPGQYYQLCEEYIASEEAKENSFILNYLKKKSVTDGKTTLQVFLANPVYSQVIKTIILEKYISEPEIKVS